VLLLLLLLAVVAGVLAVDLAVFVADITVIACTDHSYTGNITCWFMNTKRESVRQLQRCHLNREGSLNNFLAQVYAAANNASSIHSVCESMVSAPYVATVNDSAVQYCDSAAVYMCIDMIANLPH
jgi:hypothetical protein